MAEFTKDADRQLYLCFNKLTEDCFAALVSSFEAMPVATLGSKEIKVRIKAPNNPRLTFEVPQRFYTVENPPCEPTVIVGHGVIPGFDGSDVSVVTSVLLSSTKAARKLHP